jgi:hypothetical protein
MNKTILANASVTDLLSFEQGRRTQLEVKTTNIRDTFDLMTCLIANDDYCALQTNCIALGASISRMLPLAATHLAAKGSPVAAELQSRHQQRAARQLELAKTINESLKQLESLLIEEANEISTSFAS